MNGLADMRFIIDVRKEDIAVKEANRLGIPIVAVVDTNCSPEGITQVIPGNDDALRAIRLFASRIADAILEGQQIATEGGVAAVETSADEAEGEVPAEAALPASARAFVEDEDEGEADVEVADETWETAEETHEDPAGGSYAHEAEGASGERAISNEVQASTSEDMADAQSGKTEESNEATAS